MKKFALGLALASIWSCTASKEATRNSAPIASASESALPSAAAASNSGPAQGTNDHPTAPQSKWGYPPSRRQDIEERLHGVTVADPYRWLEEEKSPEVEAWLKSQDQLGRAYLSQLAARDDLVRRFNQLLYIDSIGAPVSRGKRLFYTRAFANKEKAILYWRDGGGTERVLLDPNQWSKTGEVSMGGWFPSWDGRKVAFQQRPHANDEAVLHVVEVQTGKWSSVDVIEGVKFSGVSWSPDNRSFYYSWLPVDPSIPPAERNGYQEVRLHRLGTDPKQDEVIRPKTGDPSIFQSAQVSRDGKYLFHAINRSPSENELFLKRLGKDADFIPFAKRRNARFAVHVWKDQIYVLTDDGAPNKHVFSCPGSRPGRENWKEIIPEDESATLEDFAIAGDRLVLGYLRNAASELRIASLDGKEVRTIPLPDIGAANRPGSALDPGSPDYYFEFSSITMPRRVYRASPKSGELALWAKVEVPIDPSPFQTEQVWYPSKDGTRVSMFVVGPKDMPKDGTHPVLLHGYGGFNIPQLPSFRATIYPWLEAGGVFALANLRGGNEYGHAWHEAGRLHQKQNVFDDFIAAGEYLVREKYTRPSKLAIYGGSNGGLLVGAAMTQRPELLGAVICSAPLLDMVRYHRFGIGTAWIPEYGNPDNPEDLKVLHAYSPYHHVLVGVRYPPLLMMSPAHDDRVDPMHARKFIAVVQNASASDSPALMRVETNAGHQGGDLIKKAVDSNADMYAFLFHLFGMKPASPSAPSARVR
jgi:prolyl oligopeptidase